MNLLFFTDRPFDFSCGAGRENNIHELATEFNRLGSQCFILSEAADVDVDCLEDGYTCDVMHDAFQNIKQYCIRRKIDVVFGFVKSSNLESAFSFLPQGSYICLRDADRLDLVDKTKAGGFRFASHHKYICDQLFERFEIVSESLPNPVDPSRYLTATTSEVVSFYDLSERKGFYIAVEIAKNLPQMPFLFCETWNPDQVESHIIDRLCTPLDNVSIVKRSEPVVNVLAKTKVLLLPSQWGSGARMVVEAQVSGIPCVASTECGFRELVGDAGSVLEKNAKINEWTNHLTKIFNRESHPKSLVNRAVAKAVDYVSEQARLFSVLQQNLKTIAQDTQAEISTTTAVGAVAQKIEFEAVEQSPIKKTVQFSEATRLSVTNIVSSKSSQVKPRSIEHYLLSIARHKAREDFKEAATLWRTLIEKYTLKLDPAWFVGLSQCLFEQKQYEQSVLVLEEGQSLLLDSRGVFADAANDIARKLNAIGYKSSYPALTYPTSSTRGSFPDNVILPKVIGIANDYLHIKSKALEFKGKMAQVEYVHFPFISVIIPVYNRARELEFVLEGLCQQSYPIDRFEVVIADDGSSEDIRSIVLKFASRLDINYCSQEDKGFRLAAIRNLGIAHAKYDNFVLLDSDAIPTSRLLKNYAYYFASNRLVALFGFRHYVDLADLTIDQFKKDPSVVFEKPKIQSANRLATELNDQDLSVDWREAPTRLSNNLLSEPFPFNYFVGANCGFTKELFQKAGGFSEDFVEWGHEDQEFGYRVWLNGGYFIPLWDSYVYHQEPAKGVNDTDRETGQAITRKQFIQKCPFVFRPTVTAAPPFEAPLVSIYIPCFNREQYIVEAVESALNQTVKDLEVCVCDDGSTDSSLVLLKTHYGNNPRVRVISTVNGGIAAASNIAVKMTRGCYVGQLDADDVLKQDAVERCLEVMSQDDSLSLVYGTNELVDEQSGFISIGWNWPVFTREMLLSNMIAHHFRFFRRRDWSRTGGFDETLENAVDYDMMLKLAEVGNVAHLNRVLYQYRQHEDSTTAQSHSTQTVNTFKVIQQSLNRLDVPLQVKWSGNRKQRREVVFKLHDSAQAIAVPA